MSNIPNYISETILTVGPDYKNHRGGIGAIISTYNKYFDNFRFIPSFKVGSVFFKFIFFLKCIFQLIILLTFDRKFRIVHIHGASNGSFFRKFVCFIIARYIFRKKIIYHIHGGGFASFYNSSNIITKNAIRFFIEKADIIICLSESWKIFFIDNFKPVKILVIPNIIDYPSSVLFKRERDELIFLFLGLICDAKGIFDLVHVISENKKKYKNKIKLIIGGNGEIERLNKTIKDQGLDGLVQFVGWISNNKKTEWLQRANVFILPSYYEGLPISILEAISYGQAIISTNVGGIPEIVIPEKNGILIEAGNLKELEAAIDFFLEHPEKIEVYGLESKRIVYKHLPDYVVCELSNMYELLLYNE